MKNSNLFNSQTIVHACSKVKKMGPADPPPGKTITCGSLIHLMGTFVSLSLTKDSYPSGIMECHITLESK